MKPIHTWPNLAWLLPGTVGYGLGFLLGYLAAYRWHWWADPHGIWMTVIALVFLIVAALVWFRAVDRSWLKHHRRT